jgi:hypothetical protein
MSYAPMCFTQKADFHIHENQLFAFKTMLLHLKNTFLAEFLLKKTLKVKPL